MIADGLVAGAVLARKEDHHHPVSRLPGPWAGGKVELDVQRRITLAERSRDLPRALAHARRVEAVDRQGPDTAPFYLLH